LYYTIEGWIDAYTIIIIGYIEYSAESSAITSVDKYTQLNLAIYLSEAFTKIVAHNRNLNFYHNRSQIMGILIQFRRFIISQWPQMAYNTMIEIGQRAPEESFNRKLFRIVVHKAQIGLSKQGWFLFD
jgi:hypothetical protein